MIIFFSSNTYAQIDIVDSALIKLDDALINNETYILKKEARIEVLNNRSQVLDLYSLNLYDVNLQLYNEYKAYKCDSAIAYLNKNIEIAEHLKDVDRLYESRLLQASLLARTGMYKESVDLLTSIDRKKLPEYLLKNYYNTYHDVYGEISFYTQDKRVAEEYRDISLAYRDSVLSVLKEDDELNLIVRETYFLDTRQFAKAHEINDLRLSRIKKGTPEHALATYHRSLIYSREGNPEMRKYYLAISALSDIQAAIKDHASLWMLAEILFKEGDIDRSYSYIRFSWRDTQFYNARLRSLQTAGIFSLIDQTYQIKIEQQNQKLLYYLILISFLFVLLFIALFNIQYHMKKLSVARNNLQDVNGKLQNLNMELQQANTNLQVSNSDLSESNKIKEEYIGRFIKLCSTYIDKLDTYRRMVNKKIKAGQIEQLAQITRSEDALDDELQELYKNFDTAFLQLFPDFVNKFNALLIDEEKITLKKGELLNTELRIFALIRLGIDDSSQIAEFLRYSVNTIYNYRAKVKNKAKVSRDDFESYVKIIR